MRKGHRFSVLSQFVRRRDGVAAVEFAIAAPMLILGLVIMADLGLAIQERMNMDQALRAGAEFVMGEVSNEDDIKDLVIASATGVYSDDPADVAAADPPTVTVVKVCECPENPGTTVSCSGTLCTSQLPPSVYFQLGASKSYQAIILPDIALTTEISVQTR
jgi:pilus assembly protein CpaE